MKKLLNLVWVLGLTWCMATPVLAGGSDNKQNFSAAFAGSLSRNAATDGADVAAYNPAGLMHLKNGMVVALDFQPFTFDYDHTVAGQDYSTDYAIATPSAFAIYKTDKWAVFGTFTINGGGATVEYEDGNSITKGIGAAAAYGAFTPVGFSRYEALTGSTRPNNNYLLPGGVLKDEYAKAESYVYGFAIGAAYEINSMFSIAAGVRYLMTDKKVDIHGTYSVGGNDTYIVGAYDQEADGFGGIFSVNVKACDTVNIGIRYETEVNLDWENKVRSDSRGTVGENILWMNGRLHDKEYARDMPAIFGIGVEWQITPKLSINPSFTYYFEDDADWGSQNAKVDDDSYDLAIAFRYDINETWSATLGYMYIGIGMSPDDYGIIEKMSPPLDAHCFALGAQYRMNEKWTFNFGASAYLYEADGAVANGFNPATTYDKELYSLGIGLQYQIF